LFIRKCIWRVKYLYPSLENDHQNGRVVPNSDLKYSNATGAEAGWIYELKSSWRRTCAELVSAHRTICLIKLMASTMLSTAMKRQGSSVLPLLRQRLPVFDEICGMAFKFVCIFVQVTLINIAKSPPDRSAVLVLSIIN